MGRGRQKAKHQKVARELKYHSTSIDITALERELSTGGGGDSYAERYRDEASDGDYDDATDYASPSQGR